MEIRKLNSLRGMAALIVFVTHFSDITHWLDGALGGGAGAYGVMLFFLLSGFLMSYLYLAKDFGTNSVKRYLVARFARVVPLYALVVLASFALTKVGSDLLYHIPDHQALLGHLLFLYGDSVLWSIPPEVQFYFVFVLLWALAANRPGYIYLLIVGCLLLLFFTNFPRIYGDIYGVPYNQFTVLRSLPYFFIGVVFGLHYKTLTIPAYLKKHRFVFVLCLIPLMYPELSPITSDAKNRMWLSYEVLLVMSCVFFCVVFLVPDNNILLTNKVGDFFGKISYSLYLLHMPVIMQVNRFELAVEIKLVLSLILSVACAYLSFICFEKPLARLIRNSAFAQHSATMAVSAR
ncbi:MULTISPECIES: acyltransferase [unclassified Pseudoalteromonas]|uniref:acyltransferase family protein n=1 Tax=unclassified Pseudoalteromonas TaxID=194690 RepID=UPI002096E057|nr:acyltransferase [Pseudoalteromonas sp. XMcav2-N]MCO7191228.1 acyltransferase [Pseudoalteromonas sp. XMcav2-N]